MAEFIAQVAGDDGREWLAQVSAAEEHQAARLAIAELSTRLPGVRFPKPGSVIKVVSGRDLATGGYEIAPSVWGAW